MTFLKILLSKKMKNPFTKKKSINKYLSLSNSSSIKLPRIGINYSADNLIKFNKEKNHKKIQRISDIKINT